MTTPHATNPHAGHLAATLIAGPGVAVSVDDITSGTTVDCVVLDIGAVGIIGSYAEVADLVGRASAQLARVDVERQLNAENACVDGTHSHTLSPVEDIDGGVALECTACFREFVRADDGSLTPFTRTWATPREATA